MIDIQQRLKTIFQTQRLVFWYDDNEALKHEFNEIDLDDGVKVNYCKFKDILYPITGLCR